MGGGGAFWGPFLGRKVFQLSIQDFLHAGAPPAFAPYSAHAPSALNILSHWFYPINYKKTSICALVNRKF